MGRGWFCQHGGVPPNDYCVECSRTLFSTVLAVKSRQKQNPLGTARAFSGLLAGERTAKRGARFPSKPQSDTEAGARMPLLNQSCPLTSIGADQPHWSHHQNKNYGEMRPKE